MRKTNERRSSAELQAEIEASCVRTCQNFFKITHSVATQALQEAREKELEETKERG